MYKTNVARGRSTLQHTMWNAQIKKKRRNKMQKNITTKIVAILLATLMVIGILPVNLKAETYKTADGEIKTTDWSEAAMKERETRTGSWPLSYKNRLVQVGFGDPVKTPDINYVGVYTNAEGREVVRLTFNAFTVAANQWDKLLVRLPAELAEMFDDKHPQSGIYKGTNSYGNHDMMDINWIKRDLADAKVPLEKLAWDVAGGQNVYAVDLYQNGSMNQNTKLVAPIDLVLKEGKSIKSFKEDLLVQGRLVDKNYERVYMRSGEITNDYMQYTFSTVIPHQNNYSIYLNKDLSNVGPTNQVATYNKFFSSVSSVKFNVEKGYLEVYHRHNKWATSSGYAIRQAVDSDFFNLLDEREGMVGEVYILNVNANLYAGTYEKNDDREPLQGNKIQFAKSDIYEDKNTKVGFIQIAGSEWDGSKEYKDGITTKKSSNVGTTTAILNSVTAQFNGGVYTVVRYFIKPAELKKLIKDNGLRSYTFRTSFLRPNENKYSSGNRTHGTSVFTFINDKDRVLKRGQKVRLDFDQAQYNRVAATYMTRPQIIIGDDNYNIDFINSVEYDSSGKEATWTVPFDLTIKAGEKITVKSTEWDDNQRAKMLKITFSALDFITSRKKEVSYAPIEMLNSASLTGGALISTTARPNVDEIFTDSTKITGHSLFDGAEINIKYDENGKEVKQTISAIGKKVDKNDYDYSQILTTAKYVNKKTYDAFGFDTSKPNEGGIIQGDKKYKEFKMPELKKDMKIRVDNLDTLASFIPSGDVDEQVQAKFHFDFQWDKGDIGKDYVEDKIAPLNEKFLGEVGYVANGFEGDHIKYGKEKTKEVDGKTYQNVLDHDGNEYDLTKRDQRDAFMMRQFPEDPDRSNEGLSLVGWSTMKPEDFAKNYRTQNAQALQGKNEVQIKEIINKALVKELRDAKNELKTAEQWNGAENTVLNFTRTSPVVKEATVYAVYDTGATITLHSNKNAADDHTFDIKLHKNDFKNGKAVITIPEPYYNEKDKGTFTGDEFDAFKPENKKTFVGWTLTKEDNLLLNGKIEVLNKGVNDIDKKIEYKYFNSADLKADGKNYLPNGYKLELTGTYEEWVKKGNIDLYAQYRDFIDVSIDKRFRTLKEDGKYSQVDDVDASKKHPAKLGLLYRTAVTAWQGPTVHNAANYSALPKGSYGYEETLKDYNPVHDQASSNEAYKADVTWKLPGWDKYGQRLSYAAVEIAPGEEDNYYNFSNDWSKLNITIHNNLDLGTGNIEDNPNGPKDPITGVPLAKSQGVLLNKVDAYTAATYRKAVEGKQVGSDSEVGAYQITLTNIPITVPQPSIAQAFDGDKSVIIDYKDERVDALKVKLSEHFKATSIKREQKQGPNGKQIDEFTAATVGSSYLKIDHDKANKKLILTPYPNQPGKTFKTGDKVTAQNFIGTGKSTIDEMTVIPKLASNKVEKALQTPNDNDGNSVITMEIPNPTVHSPREGTKYVLVKDDGMGYPTADDVAKAIKEYEDNLAKYEKDKAAHEADPSQPAPGEEPQVPELAKGIKEITSGIAPGASFDFTIPNADAKDGDRYKIVSIEPNKTAAISDIELTLDKKAEFENLKVEDSRFRLYTEITGKIKEADVPKDGKIEITINGETKEFTTKDGAIDYLNSIGLQDGDRVTFKVVDDLGNAGEGTATYKKTKQLNIMVDPPRARRKYVYLSSDQGATVKLTVLRNGVQQAQVEHTCTGERDKVQLGIRLVKGDIIRYEGTLGEAYSNPYSTEVR